MQAVQHKPCVHFFVAAWRNFTVTKLYNISVTASQVINKVFVHTSANGDWVRKWKSAVLLSATRIAKTVASLFAIFMLSEIRTFSPLPRF